MHQSEQVAINSLRVISAEAVEKAKSGHPGLPLGAAPIVYTLFARHLKFNPKDPEWIDRDRFVLSAGHGSALLYATLHLFGYDISMDDIQSFRQVGSKTPGHPEYRHTPGVEITTGPLGQGIANGVGMAIAETRLAAVVNDDQGELIDHYTYVLCGDGCLMEGVASEAASLAGTLQLGKLILLYDSNHITIEGDTSIAFTENVAKRFDAYGWDVGTVEDGNDIDAIDAAICAAKKQTGKPSIIIVKTEIGFASPKQGMASAHGEPLGPVNIDILRKNLNCQEPSFAVPAEVCQLVEAILAKKSDNYKAWQKKHQELKKAGAPGIGRLETLYSKENVISAIMDLSFKKGVEKPVATRISSGEILNSISPKLPSLMGGSADLGPSNKSTMNDRTYFSPLDPAGSNIHYGVREHAMAAIANGLSVHGGVIPFVSTFLVFADYMKPSLRLAALMRLPVIYVFTHDSIGVGEDGPTHQPIEHLAMLRSLPNFAEFRPADYNESLVGWRLALTSTSTPFALVLSRQNLKQFDETGSGAIHGGYILVDSEKPSPDIILIGTGSELELVYEAGKKLKNMGIDARVVSMPSQSLFAIQTDEYKESVLPSSVTARIVVEAANSYGWHQYATPKGKIIAIDSFGESGPAGSLFKKFGFTVENIVGTAMQLIRSL